MATLRYNSLVTRAAGTVAQATERLRNLEIVDRFTGATLTDDVGPLANLEGSYVDITALGNFNTADNRVFINRTLVFTGIGELSATVNGGHMYFFNCDILIQRASGLSNAGAAADRNVIHLGQASNANPATDGRVASGAAAGRSVNFYGCNIICSPTTLAAFFLNITDCFNSTISFTNGRAADTNGNGGVSVPLPSLMRGARLINTSLIAGEDRTLAVFEIYNQPDIFESVSVHGMAIEILQAGLGRTVLLEPQFTFRLPNAGVQQRFRINDGAGNANNAIQVIGPHTPFSNEAANTYAQDNNAAAYLRTATASNSGGVYNYYGWRPSFFEDGAQTIGIPDVRIRLASNIPLAAAAQAVDGTLATTLSTAFSNSATIDRTNLALNFVTDYLTDANGVPIVGAGSRSSLNGGATTTLGQVWDWLSFTRRSHTTDSNTLATNLDAQAAPDNTIVAPIQVIRNGAYNQYTATLEARSYTHTANIPLDTQNGVIGTGAGNQPADSQVNIQNNVIIAGADANVVAASEAAANLPFDASSDKTYQQLADKMKRDWAQYSTDTLRGTAGGNLTLAANVSITSRDLDTLITNVSIVFNRVDSIGGSADPISGIHLTAGTLSMRVPFGGRITANVLDAGDQNSTNSILTVNQIDSWSLAATHTGNTVNGDTTVGLNNDVGRTTISSAEIFGDNEPPGTGTITLNSNVQVTVQVQDTNNTRFAAGTNVTIEAAPMAPVTNTISIDTTQSGYYAITQTLDGTTTQVRGATRFGPSNPFTSPSFTSPTFDSADTIQVYVKYDSNINTNTFYQEQVLTFAFNPDMDTVHQVPISIPVAEALVGDATLYPATLGLSAAYNDMLAPNNVLVTIFNSSTDDPYNLIQTQGLSLAATIANEAAYFQAWYTDRGTTTTPIATFGQSDTVTWDNTRITFASNDLSGGFRVQHVINNWASTGAGTFALSRTGAGEISPQISGPAALGTVVQAVGDVFDSRNMTTDNIGNLGLLKPARDSAGNILPGN